MDANGRYILDDDGNPVECEDLFEWGRWREDGNRIVKVEQIGKSKVSTVFLGLDYNFCLTDVHGPPVLFETMVFGGPMADEMDRYTTREEANRGHAAMVAKVKDAT